MTTTKQKDIEAQITEINKQYKVMQKRVLELMAHPDARPTVVETSRNLLIQTAQAIAEAQDKLTKAGFAMDKLEGIKNYRL